MRKLIVTAIAVLILGGCATNKHRYVPKVLTTDPSKFTALNGVSVRRPVALINAQDSGADVLLGSKGVNAYYSSLKDLTETVVINTTRELAKRQVSTNPSASTALRLSVTDVSAETTVLNVEAKMEVVVVTGSGVTKRIKVTNKTPGSIPRAYNGAVSLAVIEILSDPQILTYLAAP